MKHKLLFLILIGILFSSIILADNNRHINLPKSANANISLYDMYVENLKNNNLEKAYASAELFLSTLDSNFIDSRIIELNEREASYYEASLGIFSKAIKPRLRLDNYYSLLKDDLKKARNQYRLALLYYYIEKYHLTLKYLTLSMAFFENQPLSSEKIDNYNLLAVTYYICRDYDKSNFYFNEFEKGATELKDTMRLMSALCNGAVYTSKIKDITEQKDFIYKAIRIPLLNKDTTVAYKLYTVLVNPYIENEEYDLAKKILDEALPFMKGIESRGSYYQSKGLIAKGENHINDAINFLEKAVKEYNKGEFTYKIQECLSILHNLYADIGNTKKAYDLLKDLRKYELLDANDGMYLELFKYQTELELQNEKEKLIANRNKQKMILIFISFVIVLTSIIIFQYLRKRSILVQQKEILLKNKQLEYDKQSNEMKAHNEILEIKRLQQLKMEDIIKTITLQIKRISNGIKEQTIKEDLLSVCDNLFMVKSTNDENIVGQYLPDFNTDFYKKILADFPNLTINERRLCVLLNKNFSTKDISRITIQSENAIKIARGRLRSKLGLTGDEQTIQEFLAKYGDA